MQTQKCCAFCPGKMITSTRANKFHECCQPKYITGNLRVSSLTEHVSDCPKTRESEKDPAESAKGIDDRRPSCYERFALAKKLHAENLDHQPLPDKVDDLVFKSIGPEGSRRRRRSDGRRCNCEDCARASGSMKAYGPVLGCKEPKTKMDLAICWETPMDPVYEPPKPSHIDGSEGGAAPAIFTLVHRTPCSTSSLRSVITKNDERRRKSRSCSESRGEADDKGKRCCDCLCNRLGGVSILKRKEEEEEEEEDEEDEEERPSRRAGFRKCVACEPRNFADDPRLIKSAVGLALGIEKKEDRRKKATVPRPRTPFAKRSFRIDTLAPPFSVTNRCRGADYPEHWRLMSVYQQSYRNPQKRRNYRC